MGLANAKGLPKNQRAVESLVKDFILTVDNIDVDATPKTVQQLLAEEVQLSPALHSTLDMLLVVQCWSIG